MEAAIRWSPHSTASSSRFLVLDVEENSLQYFSLANTPSKAPASEQSRFTLISRRKKLPNYTAFDWSRSDAQLIALGSSVGESHLVQLGSVESPVAEEAAPLQTLAIKHQRKCNSIAFSAAGRLATGLDRVRNDCSLIVYEVTGAGVQVEPSRKLVVGEAVTSIKFFGGQPETLVAGVRAQSVRLYDLRDKESSGSIVQLATSCVHNLAIDPLDENYFVSAGPSGNPNVCLWDRRFLSRSTGSTLSSDASGGPVLEFRPGIDNSQSASIWSLRFCGYKRGCFGILSSSGEIKILETTEHSVSTLAPLSMANPLDTTDHSGEWAFHKHYTRVTHHLQHPWHRDDHHTKQDASRVIAYDFMGPTDSAYAGHAIALRADHTMDVLRIPGATPLAGISSLNELHVLHDGDVDTYRPIGPSGSIATDLVKLQIRARKALSVQDPKTPHASHSEAAVPRRFRLDQQQQSFGYPKVPLTLPEHLGILGIQHRRCSEGYLFDARRNMEIVSNDPLLVELWTTVQTLEDLAAQDRLVAEDLDLSYLGIADIWRQSLGAPPFGLRNMNSETLTFARFSNAVKGVTQAWSAFSGPETRYPAHRQLSLAICGWEIDKKKRNRSSVSLTALSTRAEAYRAIVQAYFRGERSFALELLKSAVEKKVVDNIGLGAVIASGETVNEEQRDLCAWMITQTDDPYLRALLLYFNTGRWSSVVHTTDISLKDRVAVALRYLDDKSLGTFLAEATAAAIEEGDLEGIILTGLSNTSVRLFQKYIAQTNDLQTAILALAPATANFTPDPLITYWKESYFLHMQTWRCFIERTRFTTQLTRRTSSRPKPEPLPPLHPVTLRCLHCQAALTQSGSEPDYQKRGNSFSSTRSAATPPMVGVTCATCSRPMPRCGICMLWLGSPDPTRLPPAITTTNADKMAQKREERRDPLESQIMWCMKCLHGFHGTHAKEWFARHRICAVPDCECVCGVLH